MRGLIVLLALTSTVALFVAGFRYAPMQVDGGWASYGGFAVSQNREPYLHQADLQEVLQEPGVKSVFIFDTVSNTRALYTGLWFKVFEPGWRSLKALGILEFAILLAASALFFRRTLPTLELALLATLLLATDKMIVSMAATTFRPDVSQAALGCVMYLALRSASPTWPATTALALLSALAGAFSATAVIPVALASVFRGSEILFQRDRSPDHALRLGQVALVVTIAAGIYLSRQTLFPWLLGSERAVVEPIDAPDRIADSWAGGPSALLTKEGIRWASYFVGWNLPILLAIGISVLAWMVALKRGDLSRAGKASVAAAIGTGLGILLILDPHPRPQHLAPLIPFLLLLICGLETLERRLYRAAVWGLYGLVLVSAVSGFVMAGERTTEARAVGYSNSWLEETLAGLTREDPSLVVAGGTEFWSFWDQGSDVTIVDNARTEDSFEALEPALPHLDYAVLSADYGALRWMEAVRSRYGIEFRIVADKSPYVVIAEIRRPPPPTSAPEVVP